MLPLLLSALFAVPAPLPSCALLRAPLPVAQDDEGQEIIDKRPEIKQMLGELKDHIKKRGDQDTEALTIIDKLIPEFAESGPKDRASIVGGLSKCFEVRRKALEDGVPDNRLYMACAVALGKMAPESVKVFAKFIGHKKLDKDMVLQRELILALGKTRDPTGLKPLLKTLDHHRVTIVAAGAEALGEFGGVELKVRKEIFNELLKMLMSVKGATDSDINDTIAREWYEVLAAPLITSMGELSGQDIREPEVWQRWWNKNKRKDWDEESDT